MVGGGRLADGAAILAAVRETLHETAAGTPTAKDFAGETILITAGGTREAIDPVRFIGNRSSGRMGFAIAEAAHRRDARVILISAATTVTPPTGCETICVTSAAEMRTAVLKRLSEATVVVMAAAVSDYTVKQVAAQKLKREGPRSLELEPTQDILSEVVTERGVGTLVIGFAAETEDVLANGRLKLQRKGVDAIVVNDVSSSELGFDSANNAGIFLNRDGAVEIPPMSKAGMAEMILDEVHRLRDGLPVRSQGE
jgi:phosphopantothenoylcysteine decarboxylase/phosphopantothenate--cysteine ligase